MALALALSFSLEVAACWSTASELGASLVAIPVVLLGLVSVGLPISLLRSVQSFAPDTVKILTWGGLRDGMSVALALSLPAGAARDFIAPVTYAVAAFSIIV